MYRGYRLKIGNNILPNNMIAKGSFSVIDNDRVVEIWKDANQVEHQITEGTPKANISFSLREHDSTEHASFILYLSILNDVHVEYYDDLTDSYRVATCRIEKPVFAHLNTYGGKIQYAVTPIKIIEN